MENNVQVVRVMNPVAGLYTLQVWAHEIVHPSQAYALVVSGSLASASLARSVLV